MEHLREDINRKETFSFAHCPIYEGRSTHARSVWPFFKKVHNSSFKGVVFFKNVDVLNFELLFRLFIHRPPILTSTCKILFFPLFPFKSWISTSEKRTSCCPNWGHGVVEVKQGLSICLFPVKRFESCLVLIEFALWLQNLKSESCVFLLSSWDILILGIDWFFDFI